MLTVLKFEDAAPSNLDPEELTLMLSAAGLVGRTDLVLQLAEAVRARDERQQRPLLPNYLYVLDVLASLGAVHTADRLAYELKRRALGQRCARPLKVGRHWLNLNDLRRTA